MIKAVTLTVYVKVDAECSIIVVLISVLPPTVCEASNISVGKEVRSSSKYCYLLTTV
jgi:hypothetical protein